MLVRVTEAKKEAGPDEFLWNSSDSASYFYVLFHSDTWMGLGGTRTASIQTLYSHLYFVFIQISFSIYSIIIPIILYYFGVFQFFYRHFRDLINAELPK